MSAMNSNRRHCISAAWRTTATTGNRGGNSLPHRRMLTELPEVFASLQDKPPATTRQVRQDILSSHSTRRCSSARRFTTVKGNFLSVQSDLTSSLPPAVPPPLAFNTPPPAPTTLKKRRKRWPPHWSIRFHPQVPSYACDQCPDHGPRATNHSTRDYRRAGHSLVHTHLRPTIITAWMCPRCNQPIP